MLSMFLRIEERPLKTVGVSGSLKPTSRDKLVISTLCIDDNDLSILV